MAFDLKNKVSYVELTPELQALIDSKANQADFLAHKNDNDIHITAQEREQWNAALDSAKDYTDSIVDTIIGLIPEEGSTIIDLLNTKVDSSAFEEWKATIHQHATNADYAENAGKVNGMQVFMQPTQPSPSTSMALWFDTNNQILKAYYSGSWKATRSVWPA